MTENSVSVGVPCESVPGERRVALVPEIVRRIVATGVRVVVEPSMRCRRRYTCICVYCQCR
jgi:alanine dehydrogenase